MKNLDFKIVISNKEYTIHTGKEYATRKQILNLAGLTPAGHIKLIQLFRFGRREVVNTNDKVDLAVPNREKFIIEYTFQIEVNGVCKEIVLEQEWISRKKILELFNLDTSCKTELIQLFRFDRQEIVDENDKVDLVPKAIEKFITKSKKYDKKQLDELKAVACHAKKPYFSTL